MRSVKKILWSCAVLAVVCGCTKLETPPNKNQPSGDGTGVYKVVAHRGGYQECARPDCSISSLKYAIMLRCFASECDIVLTGDNDVLVAHPQSGYLVNGLEPFDHTVAEIRAAGTLANGEPVPTLRDFIRVLQDPELNPHGMRLWLDVKRLTKNGEEIDVNHSINACYRACEIINEMKAQSVRVPDSDGRQHLRRRARQGHRRVPDQPCVDDLHASGQLREGLGAVVV